MTLCLSICQAVWLLICWPACQPAKACNPATLQASQSDCLVPFVVPCMLGQPMSIAAPRAFVSPTPHTGTTPTCHPFVFTIKKMISRQLCVHMSKQISMHDLCACLCTSLHSSLDAFLCACVRAMSMHDVYAQCLCTISMHIVHAQSQGTGDLRSTTVVVLNDDAFPEGFVCMHMHAHTNARTHALTHARTHTLTHEGLSQETRRTWGIPMYATTI